MEKEILIKIRNALNATNSVRKKTKGYILSISSKQLCDDIRKLCPFTFNKPKSLVADYPLIPSELDSHFIRGVFDGDGCISVNNDGQLAFSIIGTKKLNEKIQKKLIKNCKVNNTKISLRGSKLSFSQLQHSGNRQVPRIMNWLYKDADIYLKRKRNIYESAVRL